MSSYFDKFTREVRELNENQVYTQREFVELVADIEKEIIGQVVLVTGDVQFPEDLREKILMAITRHNVCDYAGIASFPDSVEYLKESGTSRLIERLHDLFHDVARRRIRTRFGLLGDSPSQILALREEYDENEWARVRD